MQSRRKIHDVSWIAEKSLYYLSSTRVNKRNNNKNKLYGTNIQLIDIRAFIYLEYQNKTAHVEKK